MSVTSPTSGLSGKQLFETRGCAGCHAIQGQGGKVGPSLDDVAQRRSREYVIDQIRNPHLHNSTSVMPQLNLAPEDVEKIATYLENKK